MAEVVREVHHEDSGHHGNSGLIIGVLVVLVILIALFVFGRGFVGNRGTNSGPDVNIEGTVNTPAPSGSGQ